GIAAARRSVSHLVLPVRGTAVGGQGPAGERDDVRPRRVRPCRRRHGADADRHRSSVDPPAARSTTRGGTPACGGAAMELTLAIAIGVLTGSGVWLVLRPRTYQLVIGLSLLSYAVNLFIFSMGRLRLAAAPVLGADGTGNPADYADPVPQALVLTAIVIGFATTALLLVVLIAARGFTGSDHVDGRESR